jgi:hypothetical protein
MGEEQGLNREQVKARDGRGRKELAEGKDEGGRGEGRQGWARKQEVNNE